MSCSNIQPVVESLDEAANRPGLLQPWPGDAANHLRPTDLGKPIHGGSRSAHPGQLLALPGSRPGARVIQRLVEALTEPLDMALLEVDDHSQIDVPIEVPSDHRHPLDQCDSLRQGIDRRLIY